MSLSKKPDDALNSLRSLFGSKDVGALAQKFGMHPDGSADPEWPAVGQRRRMRRRGQPDPLSEAALLRDENGVLRWHLGVALRALDGRRARSVQDEQPDGTIVENFQFELLAPNQIGVALRALDKHLTPQRGLRELKGGELTPAEPPVGKKRRLLLVHGTFSNTENVIAGIRAAPGGERFLQRLERHYAQVLCFDHSTLELSPVLNAYDLALELRGAEGPLDVVAHSRGGLVTRWLLEGFDAGGAASPLRAVLVGSPLGGTSLAAPERFKHGLDLCSNFGTALQTVGQPLAVWQPWLSVPLALVRIVSSVLAAASRTPLPDALVSLVPGLAAQSRVEHNPELLRLHGRSGSRAPSYFVVRSNFRSHKPSWRFWRWFTKGPWLGVASDALFPGPNDLVVDTRSMTEFGSRMPAPAGVHDFGMNAVVHHTNYFEQRETLAFIASSLQVP
jgi:hypothetical protein